MTCRERRGASLIEVVIVIGVSSVLLTAGVGTLHLLMRADRLGQSAAQNRAALSRLSRVFRQDVHAARDVSLTPADPDEPSRLELTIGEGETVAYAVEDHVIQRTARNEEEEDQQHRDTFRFPVRSTLNFEREESPDVVRLTIRQPVFSGDRKQASGTTIAQRTVRLEAVLGRDHRYEKAAE